MKNSIGSTIGALLMLLALPAGLLFLWGESLRIASRLGLRGEMVRTTGVVVQVNTWTESGETYQSPVVHLTTQDGRQLTVDMWCPPFGCFWKSDIGMRVPVIYPRRDARELAVMADTLQGWASDLFVLLMGCILAATGGYTIRRLYLGLARRSKIRRSGWTGSI